MSCKLWKKAWAENQIDFHRSSINPLLQTYWPMLDLPDHANVFVPLCGKSLDMNWLLSQGCRITAVETSPIAVAAFFQANQQTPYIVRQGNLTRWHTEQIDIYCGDYFNLNSCDLTDVTAVYDHAALQAFSPEMRPRYVKHLIDILPPDSPILLLSTGYPEIDEQESLLEIDAEIMTLYQTGFNIELLYGEVGFEHHPGHGHTTTETVEEKVYLLRAHNRSGVLPD